MVDRNCRDSARQLIHSVRGFDQPPAGLTSASGKGGPRYTETAPTDLVMRHVVLLASALLTALPVAAAPLDTESKAGYQLRVVVRTGDHPALTRHFRTEILKGVTSSLQAALGPVASVEGIDLNDTPADQRDPLWALVDEKGLEALDAINVVAGPKTHFVFVDFNDGKYEIRTRQHDGSTGFVTPFVRRQVHGDRGFVARLAGLAVAQDFGVVGTFEPGGPQVNVLLKAGELGPLDPFVKKGDVFAVVQVREDRRAAAPKAAAKSQSAPAPMTATRIDGLLLQVVAEPRGGNCVCRVYNRFKGLPPRDGLTVGYRCVKLGTGEGVLRLQLADAAGTVFRPDTLQPRAGATDFPDPNTPREREEMSFADGVFTSREPFKNLAFVLVRNGEKPVARIPVEVYPDQVAVRKVNLNPATELSPVQQAAADLLDRVRSARVIQARCFEEVAALQTKDKPKALEYGTEAAAALDKEADVLRGDLARTRDRYKIEAPPGIFDPCQADLRLLESKTRELRAHLEKIKDVIRIENDPAAIAAQKRIEGLLLEAAAAVKNLDIDAAIAKYEEALKAAASQPTAKAEIEKTLTELKQRWEPKDDEHRAARKFVYEVWAKLEKPADVRDAMPQARKAFAKLKAVGDQLTLQKMYSAAPQLLQRYKDALTQMIEMAVEDEDRKALAQYADVSRELEALLTELGKEVGAK
jgi:hypothetical protein